jgi:3-hydroxymyristoyl/3-hydroxydecanoyl-(acyl carrier protein) dehydratase
MRHSGSHVKDLSAFTLQGAQLFAIPPKYTACLPFLQAGTKTLNAVLMVIFLKTDRFKTLEVVMPGDQLVVEIHPLKARPPGAPCANDVIAIVKYVPHALAQTGV